MTKGFLISRSFFAECKRITSDLLTGTPRSAKLLLLVIFSLLFLPFIDKAFHIDDAEFIYISRLIGWNPLDTAPVDYAYDGTLNINSLPPFEMSHPLLVPYIIKIISAIFGEKEIMLHLVFLVFPVLALISLAVLFGFLFPDSRGGRVLVLLFLCSLPAFLVNAQNVMTDVPTLSLLLLAMASFVLFAERDSRTLAYIGGIFLCLAAFTSYQALFFTPVILLYLLMKRKLTVHSMVSLAMPSAALLIWFLLLLQAYDFFPLLKNRGKSADEGILAMIKVGLEYQNLVQKGISLFAFIGTSGLCLVPAYILLNRSGLRFLWTFFPLWAFGYALISSITGYSVAENILLSLLVALGLSTLIIVTKESLSPAIGNPNNAERIFLLSWIIIVLGYSMIIFPWIAARHVLPIFPPIIMIMVNSLGWDHTRKRRIVIACAVFTSVLLGLGSAFSDYKLAESYRNAARDITSLRSNNNTIWYIGKWGMLHYMEKAGGQYLLAESEDPKEGDFVIIPEMPRFWLPSPQLQVRMELYAQKTAVSSLPLRLFNSRGHAGFYCSAWGLLPFSFSMEPDEVFLVLRVVR